MIERAPEEPSFRGGFIVSFLVHSALLVAIWALAPSSFIEAKWLAARRTVICVTVSMGTELMTTARDSAQSRVPSHDAQAIARKNAS